MAGNKLIEANALNTARKVMALEAATAAVGEMSMSGNATQTVLTQNVWTQVLGTTVEGYVDKFDMPSSNRLEYTGEEPIAVTVVCSLSCLGDSGPSDLEFALYRGDGISDAQFSGTMPVVITGANVPRSASLTSAVLLNPGDYVELWMQCTSASVSETVVATQMTVRG